MRAAAALWFIFVTVAALMGGLLLVSHEPGATAGRWYLGLLVIGLALGVWGVLAAPRSHARFAVASLAGAGLVAVQTFFISAFAYQGLSMILLLLALCSLPWPPS